MSEWNPIDTAPKDGSKVLLLMPGWHLRSARFIADWNCWEASDNNDRLKPTHWQRIVVSEPRA